MDLERENYFLSLICKRETSREIYSGLRTDEVNTAGYVIAMADVNALEK